MKKPALYSFLLATLLLCSSCQAAQTSTKTTSTATSTNTTGTATITTNEAYDLSFSARDVEVGYEESDATSITLNDTTSTIRGEGATSSDGLLTITAAGTYLLSGDFQGQLVVNAGDADKIQLVFNGLSVENKASSALYIQNADKVFITLAENSKNTLTDGKTYTAEEDGTKVDGVVYSKSDLTFNGAGQLTVTANYQHGIVSKDDLVITGGNYTIAAPAQGLHGKDCVKIQDGSFTLTTGTDGIQSDNAEDSGRGFVYLAGGTYHIASGTDAIQAETLLQVDGGTYTLTTGGGSANASTKSDSGWGQWGGNEKPQRPGAITDPTTNTTATALSISPSNETADASTATTESTSAKALKAGMLLIVQNGEFSIDSSDDAVHANGDVIFSGGTFAIASGDDGIHADDALTINGGAITINKSYEGLEGTSISITDGTIDLTAFDDGLNAAGGADASSISGRAGQNSFAADSATFIHISGGIVQVNASGDGIDSNGDLTISGGETIVYGPTNGGNGTFDYAGSANVTGGTVTAIGASGMAQGFGESSTQCSFLTNFDSTVTAGTEIVVTDGAGTAIGQITATKDCQSFIFSAAALQQGNAYTITAGTTTKTVMLESVAQNEGGSMGGGRVGADSTRPERPTGSLPEERTPPTE